MDKVKKTSQKRNTEASAGKVAGDHNPVSHDTVGTTTPALPEYMSRHGWTGGNMDLQNIEKNFQTELAKRKTGRMSLFTQENAATVIEGVEDGQTMDEIAKKIGTSRQVIWTWMQLSPAFHDAVAQAREYQGHASASDAVKILDEVVIDPDNPKAAMAELRKAEQRARIRMELAKAFNFKQYGDKKQNLNVNVNADISPVDLSKYS